MKLAAERAARRAAERELAEVRAQKRHLERRAIAARQTLAYGLGRALIDARSFRGFLNLPKRIRTLRLRQKAKRRSRVPDSVTGDIARRMQLVDEMLKRADEEGIEAARTWIARQGGQGARGRALAELALFAAEDEPSLAGAIGIEAAGIAPEEPRLLALVARLDAAGEVVAPAEIGERIAAAQHLSGPQRSWIDGLARDAARLSGEGVAPAAARKSAHSEAAIERVILLAPAALRSSPRVTAAADAARGAGFETVWQADEQSLDGSAVHIFAESLDFAEEMLSALPDAASLILDLAGLPRAMAALPDSEAARAEALRLAEMLAAADTVIARGPEAANLAESLGVQPLRIADGWVIDGPPGTEETAVAKAEFGLEGEGRTLAAASDFANVDGVARLIDVFDALAREGEAARLVLLGRGAGAEVVSGLAAEYGVGDRTVFVGLPAFDRWPALFGAFDAIVFPDQRNPAMGSQLPLAFALAAQMGVPSVVSEAAMRARTRDADSAELLGDDWNSAIIGALEASPAAVAADDCRAIRGLYASLRNG